MENKMIDQKKKDEVDHYIPYRADVVKRPFLSAC